MTYVESMATVRYLVKDVEESIKFYTEYLDFNLEEQFGPAFAKISKGDLVIWLSGPTSSAARPMPDGKQPKAGGWNRFVIEVRNLESFVARLKEVGVTFRNDIVSGPGGKQILIEDPSGNPIELFEAAKA